MEDGNWKLKEGERFLPQTSIEAILKPNAAAGVLSEAMLSIINHQS